MILVEIRHTPIGDFRIEHEVNGHKPWRIPRLKGGKNKAGGLRCYCPAVRTKVPRPAPKLREGEKFMKALKLRAELVEKIRRAA